MMTLCPDHDHHFHIAEMDVKSELKKGGEFLATKGTKNTKGEGRDMKGLLDVKILSRNPFFFRVFRGQNSSSPKTSLERSSSAKIPP